MSVNPFDTPGTESKLGDTVSQIFKESLNTSKNNIFGEAQDFAKAASNLHGQFRTATRKGDHVWLSKLRGFAQALGSALWLFLVSAFEIGIMKMVIELCAMSMVKILEIVTKKGRKIEISTPGVFYNPQGQPTNQYQQPAPSMGANPFGSYGYGSGVSQW